MTAFPALRPPRRSPATAYLQHLQQKKSRKSTIQPLTQLDESVECSLPQLSGGGGGGEIGGVIVQTTVTHPRLDAIPLDGEHAVFRITKPRPMAMRSRSSGTMATCASVCSDPSATTSSSGASRGEQMSAGGHSGEGENSSHSLGGDTRGHSNFPLSFPDDFVASTTGGASLETSLIFHEARSGKVGRRDSPPSSPPFEMDDERNVQLVESDQFLAGILEYEDPLTLTLMDEEDRALEYLLAETSRRWSDAMKKTQRDFCRRSHCTYRNQETIIAQQRSEIAFLKEQLQQAEDEVFPLEQIEVHHDIDDHCSVTSGLTLHYDSASFVTGGQTIPSPAGGQSNRPDAASVTGTNSVHQTPLPLQASSASSRPFSSSKPRKAPLLPPSIHDSKTLVKSRDRLMSDGTTRHANCGGDIVSGSIGMEYYDVGQIQQHGRIINGNKVFTGHGASNGTPCNIMHNHPPTRVLHRGYERNGFTGWSE